MATLSERKALAQLRERAGTPAVEVRDCADIADVVARGSKADVVAVAREYELARRRAEAFDDLLDDFLSAGFR